MLPEPTYEESRITYDKDDNKLCVVVYDDDFFEDVEGVGVPKKDFHRMWNRFDCADKLDVEYVGDLAWLFLESDTVSWIAESYMKYRDGVYYLVLPFNKMRPKDCCDVDAYKNTVEYLKHLSDVEKDRRENHLP